MNVIHFDTNALIALPIWVQQDHPAIKRIQKGSTAAACALVWYEFVCGPVSAEHKMLAFAVLGGRIEPVRQASADKASELFNLAGRARRLRTDALIAGCAMSANAELLTLNRADFVVFERLGLKLL